MSLTENVPRLVAQISDGLANIGELASYLAQILPDLSFLGYMECETADRQAINKCYQTCEEPEASYSCPSEMEEFSLIKSRMLQYILKCT